MMEWLLERFAPGPLFGWACVVFLALIPLIWLRTRVRRGPALRFSDLSAATVLPATWASRVYFFPALLRILAVLALIVALARPQAGGEYRDSGQGIAIQMVLDLSGSMAEKDFLVDGRPARRIDAVKAVFEDFLLGSGRLGGRESDLIGMTTFAMYADTPCPLTLDHGSVRDLLRQTDIPGWVDGRQVRESEEANYTALGDGLVLATDDLRRAGEQAVVGVPGAEPAKSRVMILLTDGADNPAPQAQRTSPPPLDAARVAATLGIRIYTIGAVGDENVSRPAGFFAPRRAGVDEPLLKEIAAVTGGKYFRATDVQSLKTIYDEIDRLERTKTGERTFRDDVFAAKVAMLAGLGMLLLETLLVNTRFRRLP